MSDNSVYDETDPTWAMVVVQWRDTHSAPGVWIEPGEASVDKFQTGWGVGLHVHLPYLDILRLEAGWSPDSNFLDAKLTVHSRVAF